MSQRQALRRHFRAKRRALPSEVQQQHAESIAHTLRQSNELANAQRIGLYWPADGEVDLAPLVTSLDPGKQLALPVVSAKGQMDFYRYRPGDALELNRFQIPEPRPQAGLVRGEELDLLLIPLVAFDASGTRLGMGAGYYDRYLRALPAADRPYTVGIAHEIQRCDEPLPSAAWDIPLDAVITESGWQLRS